jgi:hypothetical protein
MCVFDYRTDTLIGRFDAKGYLDVEDATLHERMAQQFRAVHPRRKPGPQPAAGNTKEVSKK